MTGAENRPRRGEAKARWVLRRLAEAGITVQFSRIDGEWGVRFTDRSQLTAAQKEVANDLLLFGITYPRCFATLARLHREEGGIA